MKFKNSVKFMKGEENDGVGALGKSSSIRNGMKIMRDNGGKALNGGGNIHFK